jgi:tRNA A-37 threonylcarbamoyl transferase component Bud32
MNTIFIHPDFKVLETFIVDLPQHFEETGESIRKLRNELRVCQYAGYTLVVKSYRQPNLFNRFIYGRLRSSKAERAYQYALLLRQAGLSTPHPVAYLTQRHLLFGKSFFVSLHSTLPYTYTDLKSRSFSRLHEILLAVARNAAAMHNAGFRHLDYSSGNILFDDAPEEIPVELVDLNRMSFGYVKLKTGIQDLERLEGDSSRLRILLEEYSRLRRL